jgi:hypothetical protein
MTYTVTGVDVIQTLIDEGYAVAELYAAVGAYIADDPERIFDAADLDVLRARLHELPTIGDRLVEHARAWAAHSMRLEWAARGLEHSTDGEYWALTELHDYAASGMAAATDAIEEILYEIDPQDMDGFVSRVITEAGYRAARMVSALDRQLAR